MASAGARGELARRLNEKFFAQALKRELHWSDTPACAKGAPMKAPSRSLATGLFRFILVALLATVMLIGTTLLIAQLTAWLQAGDWHSTRNLTIGVICGMIVWLFVAVFHLRRETHKFPFTQREPFILKAKTVLHEMGYALTSEHVHSLWFAPYFHSYLFGGGIHITLEDDEAHLTGPKVSLEIFRRYLRLLNHVQRMHQYLQDHRKVTDNLLKRVELQLRCEPGQLEAVRRNVIEVLKKDADVVCEVNLLVHSEHGIREDTVEFQVREWLEQEGIICDIHKGVVQFAEVVRPELQAV
ncbi:MAG: hypothetical protein JOZ54_15210 [Acidobacteria bacterium]|nr:hypothetical protein [Acidobacteriota bacterium]